MLGRDQNAYSDSICQRYLTFEMYSCIGELQESRSLGVVHFWPQ